MNLKITEESKMNAVRAAVRPDENVRAVAYGTLMSVGANFMYYFFGAIGGALLAAKTKYGYIILTDTVIKFVTVNGFDMNKVEDVFEIPFNGFEKVKYKKRAFGQHLVTFKLNKTKYNLTLFEKAGKHIQNQKENVNVLVQFFSNIQK